MSRAPVLRFESVAMSLWTMCFWHFKKQITCSQLTASNIQMSKFIMFLSIAIVAIVRTMDMTVETAQCAAVTVECVSFEH